MRTIAQPMVASVNSDVEPGSVIPVDAEREPYVYHGHIDELSEAHGGVNGHLGILSS